MLHKKTVTPCTAATLCVSESARKSSCSVRRKVAKGRRFDMNNNQGKEASSLVALVQAGNYQALREMVNRQGVNLDQTDEALNTPLHVAVAKNQHNMAVLLLNRGASIDRKDREGRTVLQLARSLGETGEGMVVAIQLTARRRVEEARREEKRRMVAEERERQAELLRQKKEQEEEQKQNEEDEEMDIQVEWEQEDGCDPILEAALSRLSVAREVVREMEDQLEVAKGGLARLEAQVGRLKKECERKGKSNTRQTFSLPHCSVCLEIPAPGLKVFQCPEGHIFCQACQERPELSSCPECRASLEGLSIRNRALESLLAKEHPG